ncbi:MAG: hypothetical protein ACFCU5_07395 [Pleurocapsa sp.]
MTEDFKQALRSGNLKEAFLLAMSKAPELHITTWIASPQDNPDRPQGDKSLRTHINLIEGKIENQIGEQLLGDRHPQIQQFHHQQVIQGHQTIQQNLESLQKMFRLMAAFQQRQQQGNLQSSWIDVREANKNELNGNNHVNAIAGSVTSTELSGNKAEPQLPSFTREEDDDAVVKDLLSLADLDEEEEVETTDQEDWGDWLEENEEPINTQFVDPNSINPHQG